MSKSEIFPNLTNNFISVGLTQKERTPSRIRYPAWWRRCSPS